MENSILDSTQTQRTSIHDRLRERSKAYNPLSDLTDTGYDNQFDTAIPEDDYSLISYDNPAETVTDETAGSNSRNSISSWLQDAWTTFQNSRDNINLMSERGILDKDIMPVINDIDFELGVIDLKKQIQSLDTKINSLNPNSQEYATTVDHRNQLQNKLNEQLPIYEATLKRYGDSEGNDLDARSEALLATKEDYTKRAQKILDNIKEYNQSLDERNSNYQITKEFQQKEQLAQDIKFSDIFTSDFWKYAAPGLFGSSFATAEAYGGSIASAYLAQLGKTAALRAATKFGGPYAAIAGEIAANAAALVGIAGTVASNWYSRKRESLAQVHGAYRSRVEKDLKDKYGVDINSLVEPARQAYAAQHPYTDTSKLTDDQIIDMFVTGEIDLQDDNLRSTLTNARKGLDNVYNNNMALSTMDVVETAVMLAPVGKLFKTISKPIAAPLGKVTETLAAPVKRKLDSAIDFTIDFNRKLAYTKPVARAATKTAQELGKIGFLGLSEGYEEAQQDIFDYDYIHGKYDNKSAGLLNSVANYGDSALRTTKILLGMNSDKDLANDEQFWSDMWGGFALGLFMGGGARAVQAGANGYSEFKANQYVRNVVADKIATDDDLLKTELYTDKATTNGIFNPDRQAQIIEVLEGLKNYPPEGVTAEDIDAEIKRAKDIMSTADSYSTKQLAKSIGITPGTPEYNAYITMRVNSANNLKEAVDNNQSLINKNAELYNDITSAPELAAYPVDQREAMASLGRLNIQKSAIDELIEGLQEASKATEALKGIIPSKVKANSEHLISKLQESKKTLEQSANNIASVYNVDPDSIILSSKDTEGRRLYQQLLLSEIDVEDNYERHNELLGIAKDSEGRRVWYNKLDDFAKENLANRINNRINSYLENLNKNKENLDARVKEDKAPVEVPTQQTTTTNQESGVVEEPVEQAPKLASNIMDPEVEPEDDIKLGWETEEKPKEPKKEEKKPETRPNSRGRGSAMPSEEATPTSAPVVNEPKKSTQQPTVRNVRGRGSALTPEELEPTQAPVAKTEPAKKVNPRGRGTAGTPEGEVVNPAEEKVVNAATRKKVEKAPVDKVSIDDYVPEEPDLDDLASYIDSSLTSDPSKPVDLSQESKTRAEVGEEPLAQVEYSREIIETTNKLAELEEAGSDAKNALLMQDIDNELFANMGNSTRDKVSSTFFYQYDSTEPMDKGYKSGKELSTLLSNPKALEESTFEFDVVSWNGDYKPGKPETYDSAAVRLIVTHNGDKYILSLKEPNGARILLNRINNNKELTGEELAQAEKENEEAIKRLTDYRNSIIKAFESKKPGESIVPSIIYRSNGKFNVNRVGGKAIQRPIQQVKGLDIPNDPWAINPDNVTFGVGGGARGDNKITNKEGVALLGKGGSGTLYIYPKASQTPSGTSTTNIQIQVSRFNDKVAKAILGLIIKKKASPIEYLTNKKGEELGITAERLLNFLVRFGENTMIRPNLKSKVPHLVSKQFNLDGNKLYIGDNVYTIDNLSKRDIEDLTEFVKGMHWRIDRDNIFKTVREALPEIEKYFENHPDANEVEIFDGLTFTRDQFGMSKEHTTAMPMLGWYTSNELLLSDLNDQIFDAPFVYASGISTTESKTVAEPVTPKQENIKVETVNKPNARGRANPFTFGDVLEGFGAPRLFTEQTTGSKIEAEEVNWLRKKLGLSSDQLSVVDKVIDLGKTGLKAMGLTKKDSIVLYKGAEYGTAYHEAFHRVSLLLLTPDERRKIYEAYRKKNGVTDSDKQIEEALAEGFREWKIAKQPTNDFRITKFFKKLWSFISRFANLSNTSLNNIYDRIESGYFKNKKVNAESAKEFENNYNIGAPFTIKGHNFQNITVATFDEVVNTLVARLFNINSVELADQVENIDFNRLYEDLKPEYVAEYEGLTANQRAVLNEVYDTFETVFLPEIRKKITDYGINTQDSVEAQEERAEKIVEGEGVADSLAQHILSPIEISRKDTALASVKLFVATIPDAKFVDGKLTPIISQVTGMLRFGDFNKNWNTILNNLHDCKTWNKLLDKVNEDAKEYPFFASLKWKLGKVKSETLQTQIINTISSAYHNMITVLAKQNGDNVSVYINDSNFNRASKVYPQLWNTLLLGNEDLFTISGDKVLPNQERIGAIINSYKNLAELVNNGVLKPNNKVKNSDRTYNEFVNEFTLPSLKNKLLDILGNVGINIDMETLNDTINKYYRSDNSVIAFNNFINATSNDGLSKLFTYSLQAVKDIDTNPESKTYGVMTFNNRESNINSLYSKNEIVKRLAEAYAMRNPNPEELTVLGTDGKLLYPISAHNYLSDMVQYLNTDPSYAKKMSEVMYNSGRNGKGSALIKHALKGGKLQFNTMVAFKKQSSSDQGRKYTEISPLEDYVAKMSLIRNDHLVNPTMGDSAMYNTISGMKLAHKHLLITSDNKIQFDYAFIEQYINYFLAELDTIETNYDNESKINETNAVKNYHTGKRNGYRFRYFSGFFNGKGGLTDFNNSLALAEKLDEEQGTVKERTNVRKVLTQIRNDFNSFSMKDKIQLMNNYVKQEFIEELKYAAQLGLIKFDGKHLDSIKNKLLDKEQFNNARKVYKNSSNEYAKKHADSLAAMDVIADYYANTIIAIEEFEKVFIKDPAYYKDPVDKIKRIREVLSTGTTPRTEYDPGSEMNDLKELNVAMLSDNEIPSREITRIYDKARKAITKQKLLDSGMSEQEAATAISEDNISEDVKKAVEKEVEANFSGYSEVNQTDATVLLSPEGYKQLVRRIDGWPQEVEEAFNLLNDPNAEWESDPEKYSKALAVSLKPLKMMYFGDHYDSDLKLDIPIFDKMALFPVHKIFSKGDLGKLLERMENPNNPVHMVTFESAVKVGQRSKIPFYLDKENKVINQKGLDNMITYKQDLKFFRRQLITDPHHSPRQMFVSQAQKAMMGNLRMDRVYTTVNGKQFTGEQVKRNIKGALDALTAYGRKSVENTFGITSENGEYTVDINKMSSMLIKDATTSDMNQNVMEGLETRDGRFVVPLSALSDNAWMESRLITNFNRDIIDVKTPGGMFIQMSSFTYNSIATDATDGRKRFLNYANEDGSMDAVISINLLKHVIPNYDSMSFLQAKQWLIDHNIIGNNAKPAAIGYRIPAQGQSSTAALKIVDIYPEQIGDAITLPDEFTKLTGSDFDIDKLFLARYNYNDKGELVTFNDSMDDLWELRKAEILSTGIEDQEYIAKEEYKFRSENTIFELNSKAANENRLLEMYMTIISNPDHFAETRVPLDTTTDYLKNTILAEVDSKVGKDTSIKSPLYYLTPQFQSKTKMELNGGKTGIGPFALNSAHHVLTQLTNMVYKPSESLKKYGIGTLNGIFGKDGKRILDWLSAMINAHVDVAKDPYIMRLNVVQWTYNMTNFLLRNGVGESTFYFLPQPILKDMANKIASMSGKFGVPEGMTRSQIERKAIQEVFNEYLKKARKLASSNQSPELKMLANINKPDMDLSSYPNTLSLDKEYLKKQLSKEETYEWYRNQLLIFSTFKELSPYAKDMSDLVNLSQIDTKKFGNNFGLQESFLYRLKSFVLNPQNSLLNPRNLFTDTFLYKKIQDGLVFPRKVFTNTLLRTSPTFASIRTNLFALTGGLGSKDDSYINSITRGMEAAYKSSFFNKYIKENNIDIKDLMYGSNSVPKRLTALKKEIIKNDKYKDLLASDGTITNTILSLLNEKAKLTSTDLLLPNFIQYNSIKNAEGNMDNMMIRSWEELLDSDHAEVRKFAEDLVLYAFYTSGDNPGANSLFKYVPNNYRERIGYFDFIRGIEENPDSLGQYINIDEFFKNNWNNEDIVPTIELSRERSDQYGDYTEHMTGIYSDINGGNVLVINGEKHNYPLVLHNTFVSAYDSYGLNKSDQPVYPPYVKVKLDPGNPLGTLLYKSVALLDEKPVYVLVNKKGTTYQGSTLVEYGMEKSMIEANNPLKNGDLTLDKIYKATVGKESYFEVQEFIKKLNPEVANTTEGIEYITSYELNDIALQSDPTDISYLTDKDVPIWTGEQRNENTVENQFDNKEEFPDTEMNHCKE